MGTPAQGDASVRLTSAMRKWDLCFWRADQKKEIEKAEAQIISWKKGTDAHILVSQGKKVDDSYLIYLFIYFKHSPSTARCCFLSCFPKPVIIWISWAPWEASEKVPFQTSSAKP